ncbi:MAG: DinB family protein [Saprospiraceae bacterium]|nr:DinB family protein [Saprospiraceae bacterium]
MQTAALLDRLVAECRYVISEVEKHKHLELDALRWRKDEQSWNILECVEHLNRYGVFYLPAIESAIQNARKAPGDHFAGGWLGRYFANSMLPKVKLNKMKTFKDKNPLNTPLDPSVIEVCIQQQIKMMELIERSREVSLEIRVSTSLSSLLRLKLGDTFQFVINHNLRHVEQIKNVLKSQSPHQSQPRIPQHRGAGY